MIHQLTGKLTDITESFTEKTHKTTVNIYDYLEFDGIKYGNMQVPDVINRHLVKGVGEQFTIDYMEVMERSTPKRTIIGVKTQDGKFDHISDIEMKPALTAMKALFALNMFTYSIFWTIFGGIIALVTYFMTKSSNTAYMVLFLGYIVVIALTTVANMNRMGPIKEALAYIDEKKDIV
ncbi:hypothetical protein I6E85_11715 [Pseudoalteromonas sp. NZS71]|uniref:hypothetical protein n=1 Tax=unclassified Pseudoalteromonas TaxID=194690 RepID=UPI0003F52C6E|nr:MULTISPECIES: hypothetical protein [unclassified Pseudoalteromonas]MBH0061825.1 hypothetical protein [Pseudoalteromonas sp. NZS71]